MSWPRAHAVHAVAGNGPGNPARMPAERPMVRPWSPTWVVAATATSSMRLGKARVRRANSRKTLTTRSSARVSAKMPFLPALPNGVRTPSANTTGADALTHCDSQVRHLDGCADGPVRASSLDITGG